MVKLFVVIAKESLRYVFRNLRFKGFLKAKILIGLVFFLHFVLVYTATLVALFKNIDDVKLYAHRQQDVEPAHFISSDSQYFIFNE